jgi:3-oxoacyl-[acyl-carrier protein] reductase
MSSNILVVGGNSGIGLATVRLLIGQGHRLSVACRTPGPLQDLDIPPQEFDALSPSQLSLPERLDGLVYFPGTITLKPFHRLTTEDFEKEWQINFMGAVNVLQQAMQSLKNAEAASVVLFSTIAVQQGMPFHASIASSKAAVEGLTRSLAAEWAPRIRVNCIAPSLTNTKLAESLLNSDAKQEAAAKRHPLQAVGNPEDVASLVAWLLSENSRFLTGQILRPDGGLSSVRTFG